MASDTRGQRQHDIYEYWRALAEGQAAKIAELEMERDRHEDYKIRYKSLLTRAVEAMRKVPHRGYYGELLTAACRFSLEIEACARQGGACAFKALIEEIESAQ